MLNTAACNGNSLFRDVIDIAQRTAKPGVDKISLLDFFAVHEYFVDFYVQLSRNNLVKCREHWSHTCTDRKKWINPFPKTSYLWRDRFMIQGQRLAFYRSPVINGGEQIRSGLAVWRSAAQAAASLTCTLAIKKKSILQNNLGQKHS